MKKAAVMDFASKLPEETSIDEIIERLIIVEKIEKGRQQVKDQKVNSEDQAMEKLNIWLSQFDGPDNRRPSKHRRLHR